MGYDMYIVGEPTPEEAAAAETAKKAFHAAVEAWDVHPRGSVEANRLQAEVERAAGAWDAARTDYFRLNIFGMSRCCEIMVAAGMLKAGHPDEDWPEFPLADEYRDAVYEAFDRHTGEDLRATQAWQEYYGPASKHPTNLSDEQWEQARSYAQAHLRHLTLHDRDTPGISAHKFRSNNGWIVTPPEIKYALKIWDELGEERRTAILARYDNPTWFTQWIDWLRIAEQRGGFAVH